jgi:hypothetical protein
VTPSLDDFSDPHEFIAGAASQAAYWADLSREAAAIRDDALLAYAVRKAAAYARAFIGAAKDILTPNEGGGT